MGNLKQNITAEKFLCFKTVLKHSLVIHHRTAFEGHQRRTSERGHQKEKKHCINAPQLVRFFEDDEVIKFFLRKIVLWIPMYVKVQYYSQTGYEFYLFRNYLMKSLLQLLELIRLRALYNFVQNDVIGPILHECSFSGEMMRRRRRL